MDKDQKKPLVSQCLSACSKSLAFQKRAAFSICLLPHPGKPCPEHRWNACSTLQSLWPSMGCPVSPPRGLRQEEHPGVYIEDLPIGSSMRAITDSHQYTEIKEMEARWRQGGGCPIRKTRTFQGNNKEETWTGTPDLRSHMNQTELAHFQTG